jgi:integrase
MPTTKSSPGQAAQIKAMTKPKRRVLTEPFVRNQPPTDKDQVFPDAQMPGLKLRIRPSGHRSFVLRARLNPSASSAVNLDLGTVGEISLRDARTKAREWIAQIKQGIDPRAVIKAERANTVSAAVELYLKRHVAGKRKAKDTAREIQNEIVSRWGSRPLTSIRRADIIAMTSEIVDRGARSQARNILTHAKTLFAWAVENDLLAASPAAHVSSLRLIGAKVPRQRVLTDDELRALWSAADGLGYPLGPFLKMLLLTGQRRSEVARVRWREFDLTSTSKLWTIPAERYKSAVTHIVPLSPAMVQLLEQLPRWTADDYLFSNDGRTPITLSGVTKAKIDAVVGAIPHWTIHDLRRTCRTRLSGLGVPDHIAELTIGHSRKGLARVYDLHRYEAEMRHALEAWAARLAAIVAGPDAGSNVVSMGRRRT